MRISACLIVKNEEHQLGECLDSIAGAVDEMVVVDTGSTDRTVTIAGSFGAKVLRYAWSMDFSAARNFGFDHANGDWIFWLDAHDRLPADSARRLRRDVQSAGTETGALLMHHYWPPSAGAPLGWVLKKPFLVRNAPGIRFRGRVHEQIRPAIRASGYAIGDSGLPLRHGSFVGSLTDQHEKSVRYLAILEDERSERPDDPMLWYCLGMAYKQAERRMDAESAFVRYLSMAGEDDQRQKALVYLVELAIERNDLGAAQSIVTRALAEYPQSIELQFKLGCIRFAAGAYGEAAETFQRVLDRSPADLPNYCNLADVRFWPVFYLGAIATLSGKYETSVRHLTDASAMCPDLPLVWQALAETLWRTGRRTEAEAAMEKLRALDQAEWRETRGRLDSLAAAGGGR